MIVADKHGNILHADKGRGASRPEIARHNIMKLFLSILPKDSISFGTKVVSATRDSATSEATLELESIVTKRPTTTATYDLVVGADGAWSTARSILSPERPQPSGVHYLTMNIKHISTRYPHLASLVGKGALVALGNKHGIDSHRAAQDSALIYVFLTTPPGGQDEAAAPLSGLSTPELRELVAVALDEEARAGREVAVRCFAERAPCRPQVGGLPNAGRDARRGRRAILMQPGWGGRLPGHVGCARPLGGCCRPVGGVGGAWCGW